MNPFKFSMTPGVANYKKADLDALTQQITTARLEVADLQNIVAALTAKATEFTGFLATADANRTAALTNFNLVRDASSSVFQLTQSADLASKQASRATKSLNLAGAQLSELIYKLVFSCEIIDKVTQLVNKQKAINPIIPDDLIKFLSKASTDANLAMAATLTALSSCYAAEATGTEGSESLALAFRQINDLGGKFLPPPVSKTANSTGTQTPALPDMVTLFDKNYQQSLVNYEIALAANTAVGKQLADAQVNLASANTKLNSVTSGLAAATAAAFAA